MVVRILYTRGTLKIYMIYYKFIGGAGPSGYSPTSPTYSPTSPSYDTEEGDHDDKKKSKGKSKSSKKK